MKKILLLQCPCGFISLDVVKHKHCRLDKKPMRWKQIYLYPEQAVHQTIQTVERVLDKWEGSITGRGLTSDSFKIFKKEIIAAMNGGEECIRCGDITLNKVKDEVGEEYHLCKGCEEKL